MSISPQRLIVGPPLPPLMLDVVVHANQLLYLKHNFALVITLNLLIASRPIPSLSFLAGTRFHPHGPSVRPSVRPSIHSFEI